MFCWLVFLTHGVNLGGGRCGLKHLLDNMSECESSHGVKHVDLG